MAPPPRILFLANWPHTHRSPDNYAFFAHWASRPKIRFLGTLSLGPWSRLEKRVLRFYLLQPLLALLLAPFYDAVIAFSAQSGLPFAALLRVFFWMRTKLLVFDVESLGRARGGLKLFLTRFASRRIDHLVYPTRAQEKYYDEFFPWLKHRRSHLRLGIGGGEKTPDFAAGRDGPMVALGRQGAAFRDWATLLRAYAELTAPVELHIIGRSDLPPAERGGVPIPPGVKLIPYLPAADLRDRLAAARFVILPLPERSQSQGQLSLLFGQAMGKAVVASRIDGLVDYLVPEQTGLFYRPGDAGDLAACLRRLLDDPDLAECLGRKGHAAVVETFNDRRLGREWEELFFLVTGRSR